jgi:hypothetical protein
MVSLVFLSMGVLSMLALGRGVAAANSDGLSADDVMVLVMLVLISLMVASQVLSLLRTLPGIRNAWRWAARARQRRNAPTPLRPLLAQADARSLFDHMSPPRGSSANKLRPLAGTAGWVALTLVIMAAATAGAAVVGLSAIRSIGTRGWGLGTLLGVGMAVLIGYGVTALSIGLIRSWFERRRRRLRRMLMRLLRYLLRGFDRSTAALPRMLGRFDGRTGLMGRGILVTFGAAIVVAASTAIPVSAVGGIETNTVGLDQTQTPTPTATSVSVDPVVAVENETTQAVASTGNPPEKRAVASSPSDPTVVIVGDTTTSTVGDTTTTRADTTTAAGDTTTTVAKSATTTTVAKSATTTTVAKSTTTTTVADTTGPIVSRISDSPDPIFTFGNPPDTAWISATTSDFSGVATVTVYYRVGKGGFVVWGSMKPGASSIAFGPFATIGIYEYRIMATDTLGNANCKMPSSCPGGTVTVIIP